MNTLTTAGNGVSMYMHLKGILAGIGVVAIVVKARRGMYNSQRLGVNLSKRVCQRSWQIAGCVEVEWSDALQNHANWNPQWRQSDPIKSKDLRPDGWRNHVGGSSQRTEEHPREFSNPIDLGATVGTHIKCCSMVEINGDHRCDRRCNRTWI